MASSMRDDRVRHIEFKRTVQRFRFAMECLNKVMEVNSKLNINFVFSPPCIYEALLLTYLMFIEILPESLKQILLSKDVNTSDITYYFKKEIPEKRWLVNYPQHVDCYHDARVWLKYEEDVYRLDDAGTQIFHGPIMQIKPSWDFEMNMNRVNKFLKEGVAKLKSIYHPVQLFAVEQPEKETKKGEKPYFILATSVSCKFSKSWIRNQARVPSIPIRDRIINYYNERLKIHVTDILYEDGKMSLFIISPALLIEGGWKVKDNISNTDLLNLTARLSDDIGVGEFRSLLRNSRLSNLDKISTNISVVPDFEVEKDLNMEELLKSFKLDLLKSDKINLNMTDKENRGTVNFSYAVHRSRIKATINELVVGATTVILSAKGSVPESKIVNVKNNKPFVWLIYDRNNEEILSVGICNSAKSNCHIKPLDINQAGPSGVLPMKKPRLAETS